MSGREPGSGGEGGSRLRLGIYGLVALANAAALLCVLNPWFEEWSAAGTIFLVLEVVFLGTVGVPVFLYHFVRKGKPFKQSLSDSVETVMELLVGWA